MMGKWRVFAHRVASSLIWVDGGLLFHIIFSKIVACFEMNPLLLW